MRMQDSFSDDFVSAVDVFKKALAVKKRRSMKGKGESRARVARPKILVYIYIYMYMYNVFLRLKVFLRLRLGPKGEVVCSLLDGSASMCK